MHLPSTQALQNIYGETAVSSARFENLAQNFARIYHNENAEFFTAPGRTEIIGNHTDHNGGQIVAASIDMDTVCAAAPNDSSLIRITSEGYDKEILVDLTKLDEIPKESGTPALLAGMMEGASKYGFTTAGFDAYVSTNVISAAGVSSSASFEMLICAVMNYFFNEGAMTCADYAKIGKYAENVYWDKASGMMDQMACAVGGTILLDFADQTQPGCEKLPFSFAEAGYQLVIVNTGKGHADLSREYSEIPEEMREAAAAAGAELLCETSLDALLSNCSKIKNDRAVLRAIHFFCENDRVRKTAQAISDNNIGQVLALLQESGTSSWELLQNCYSLQDCTEQKITLTLALTDLFLKNIGDGICRVHGGGFAGVIMAIVPQAETEHYTRYIAQYVGEENVYPMNIRKVGTVHIPRN